MRTRLRFARSQAKRISTIQISPAFAVLENECTDDGYEPDDLAGALDERQIRAECARDPRVAQALGR